MLLKFIRCFRILRQHYCFPISHALVIADKTINFKITCGEKNTEKLSSPNVKLFDGQKGNMIMPEEGVGKKNTTANTFTEGFPCFLH